MSLALALGLSVISRGTWGGRVSDVAIASTALVLFGALMAKATIRLDAGKRQIVRLSGWGPWCVKDTWPFDDAERLVVDEISDNYELNLVLRDGSVLLLRRQPSRSGSSASYFLDKSASRASAALGVPLVRSGVFATPVEDDLVPDAAEAVPEDWGGSTTHVRVNVEPYAPLMGSAILLVAACLYGFVIFAPDGFTTAKAIFRLAALVPMGLGLYGILSHDFVTIDRDRNEITHSEGLGPWRKVTRWPCSGALRVVLDCHQEITYGGACYPVPSLELEMRNGEKICLCRRAPRERLENLARSVATLLTIKMARSKYFVRVPEN